MTGELLLPDGITRETAFASVRERLELRNAAAGEADRTFYDTFDGLLREAGLAAMYAVSDARMVLCGLDDGAERASTSLGERPERLLPIALSDGDLREALVKVYAAHGMSPLSPMLGCLPMLLPMPILFALYFVFQNTIEFRDVQFLWLPDISLKDPLFIIPIVMGGSMFLLSWIGMRGMPPNPQAKMMSYMMPVMFTVMFLNFASGLNLYYAVQNIAALPQQWVLTRERAKAAAAATPAARKT